MEASIGNNVNTGIKSNIVQLPLSPIIQAYIMNLGLKDVPAFPSLQIPSDLYVVN